MKNPYKMMKTAFVALSLILSTQVCFAQDKTYTAYNMWFENPQKMYSINYQKGTLIPVGTEVTDVSSNRKRISFTIPEWDMSCVIHFTAKYHPGKTAEDIKNRAFQSSPKEEYLSAFTQEEREAIETGQVTVGMSREAVLASVGYPPEHRTPSISLPSWVYWIDRWRSREVTFDSEGKTTNALVK